MLTLYEPKYEDLWFRQMMLADEDTMSYNHAWGGTIPFGEDKWRGWYDCWIADPDGKRYYRYLKNEDGQFVGEIAYHYDAEMQQEIANVMIYAKYRRDLCEIQKKRLWRRSIGFAVFRGEKQRRFRSV